MTSEDVELDKSDIDSYYNLACIYSLNIEKEKAINYLRIAIELGLKNRSRIKDDPDLDNIRNIVEFKKLLKSTK